MGWRGDFDTPATPPGPMPATPSSPTPHISWCSLTTRHEWPAFAKNACQMPSKCRKTYGQAICNAWLPSHLFWLYTPSDLFQLSSTAVHFHASFPHRWHCWSLMLKIALSNMLGCVVNSLGMHCLSTYTFLCGLNHQSSCTHNSYSKWN